MPFTWTVFKRTVCVACIFVAAPAMGATPGEARDSALAYLISQQNGDGSWGTGDDKVRATATVLAALRQYGVTGLIPGRGLTWLGNSDPATADSRARKLKQLAASALQANALIDAITAQATVYTENPSKLDRVWGGMSNYQGSVFDTALVVEALVAAGINANQYGSVDYLIARWGGGGPNAINGGWSYEAQGTPIYNSAIIPTAQAILALSAFGATPAPTALTSGTSWLIAQQNASGGFGDLQTPTVVATALGAQALIRAKSLVAAAAPAHANAVTYLLASQNTDGSWSSGDIYATALAAAALFDGPQSAVDSDGDGVSDTVEALLNTNPNQYDVWGSRSNGNNDTTVLGVPIVIIASTSAPVNFNLGSGGASITGGRLPAGVSLSGTYLIGTPGETGVFNFSYRLASADGRIVEGPGQLRVNAPVLNTGNGAGGGTPSFIPGDIDGDGVLSISDLWLLSQHLLGAAALTTAQQQRADIYPLGQPDGALSVSDYWTLEQMLLGSVNP